MLLFNYFHLKRFRLCLIIYHGNWRSLSQVLQLINENVSEMRRRTVQYSFGTRALVKYWLFLSKLFLLIATQKENWWKVSWIEITRRWFTTIAHPTLRSYFNMITFQFWAHKFFVLYVAYTDWMIGVHSGMDQLYLGNS